jgi:hypothetical protein
MSQNKQFSFVNDTSSDVFNNSNNGWANFETFDQNSESISVTIPNNKDDDWADFQSNTDDSILSTNSLSTDQIETIISTCFPLESSTLSVDTDNFIPFELPTLTTFNDQMKQLPCFKPSLCLWNVLSNISNDPLGIKYQWHKSNTERLFHRALGVHKRCQTKTIPIIISNVDSDFDWKQSDLSTDNIFDVSLDSYVPPIRPSASPREQSPISSSRIIHRTDSPIISQQSTPIKTMDLFPGSTTVLNDDPKPPVVNTSSNFSFINPKALMSSTQITHE